ncbi:hypothetical protein IKO50_05635, partial [bacterium]|nr:hypothetical protein [bacterium]
LIICRILFFKMTDHLTFGNYILKVAKNTDNTSTDNEWKRSTIITTILERKSSEILAKIPGLQTPEFNSKKHYLERASNLLGHIKNNSGLSVIIHYVVETISVIQTLCNVCRDLNFDDCLIYVLITSNVKHLYLISKVIQHFILSRVSLDTLFATSEISAMGVFPSAMLVLLKVCRAYDKRILDAWA